MKVMVMSFWQSRRIGTLRRMIVEFGMIQVMRAMLHVAASDQRSDTIKPKYS